MQPKPLLKLLTLIHASMCIGLAIFAGYAYLQNRSFELISDYGDVFVYVVPVLAMAGYIGSKLVYQNILRNLAPEKPLSEKLQQYQIANIIKYALLEGPAFLSLGIYLIDGNALYLVIGLCLMLYLFFQRPALDKMKNELPLNLEEQKEFDTLNR